MKSLPQILHLIFFLFVVSNNSFCQNEKSEAQVLTDSGNIYLNSNIKKAEDYYNRALELSIENKNNIQKSKILSQLGILNHNKSDYPKALDYYFQSLDINLKLNDSSLISSNYHNIAMVMRYQNDYDASKNYFEKAIDIQKALNTKQDLATSYNMLGIIYRLEGNHKTAEDYYLQANSIFIELNDRDNIISTHGNLATLYALRGEYKNSIVLNLKSVPYYKLTNKKNELSIRYTNIALSFEKLKMYETAIKFLDSAITLNQEQGYLEDLASSYLYRSNKLYSIRKYKKSIDDYRAYKQVNDSVFNLKKTKEITTKLLQVEYEKQKVLDSIQFSETEKQLELIAKSEKNKKNTFIILLIGSLILGGLAFNTIMDKRNLTKNVLEKERLESELLQQKLIATEREAQRIIGEKSISLTHKKNLVGQIKHLIKKQDSKSIFTDLNMLTIELNEQTKTETLHYILDESMEKLHVEFEQKLIKTYPNLTKTEREICSLIRSKMSIKDIVNIKGVSSASVQSARYRIRKKLKLEKGTELQQYLQELF